MNDDIKQYKRDYHKKRRSPNKTPMAVLLGLVLLIAVLFSAVILGNNDEQNESGESIDASFEVDVSLGDESDGYISDNESLEPTISSEPSMDESEDESEDISEPSKSEESSKVEESSKSEESFYYDESYVIPDESEGIEFDNEYNFSLSAEFAIVYDLKSGEVLFAKNATDRAYPASITKLMTSIVALKYCDPDDVFTAGDELSFVVKGSSLAFIYKGHKLKLKMLIDAMMLPSGNDAAYVVAANAGRIIAGDKSLSAAEAVSVFVDKMNEEAKRLGCKGTHFANPDGFHDDRHFTTAYDLALISEEALKYEVINKSVKKEQVDAVYESGQMMTWINSNYLIRYHSLSTEDRKKWYSEYATGLKTGTTSQAGSCMVASAKKGDREIVAVLLKCKDGMGRYEDALEIINTIF